MKDYKYVIMISYSFKGRQHEAVQSWHEDLADATAALRILAQNIWHEKVPEVFYYNGMPSYSKPIPSQDYETPLTYEIFIKECEKRTCT